jgi:hypothetical protein
VLADTGPLGIGSLREGTGHDPARAGHVVDDEPPPAADVATEQDVTTGQSAHENSPIHSVKPPSQGKSDGHRQPWRMSEP